MRGVLLVRETIRRQRAAEMIAAARWPRAWCRGFFRPECRARRPAAPACRSRVRRVRRSPDRSSAFRLCSSIGLRISTQQRRVLTMRPSFTCMQAERAVLVVHRELPARARRHVVDFARRQIRDVRAAAAETVALLRLLPGEIELQRVGACRRRRSRSPPSPRASCRAAAFPPRGSPRRNRPRGRSEDDLIHPVHRRAAEAELLRKRRQRRRRGVGRDAEDEVVFRVNRPPPDRSRGRRSRRRFSGRSRLLPPVIS